MKQYLWAEVCYCQWEAYMNRKEEQYNTDLREEETLQDMKENDWIISEIWNGNLSPKPWLREREREIK